MRIFNLHTSTARYELKVVLLHLWGVNVKAIGGFINITLTDLSHKILRHNNFTILLVGRDSTGPTPDHVSCVCSLDYGWTGFSHPDKIRSGSSLNLVYMGQSTYIMNDAYLSMQGNRF